MPGGHKASLGLRKCKGRLLAHKFCVPQHKDLSAQANGGRSVEDTCLRVRMVSSGCNIVCRMFKRNSHPSDPLFRFRMANANALANALQCICKCPTCNPRADGDTVERGRGKDLGAETRESTSPHLLGAAQVFLPIIAFERAHRRLRASHLQFADTVTDRNLRKRFAAAFASAAHSPATRGALPPSGNLPFE